MTALKIDYLLNLEKGDYERIHELKAKISELNPLSHFIDFEVFYHENSEVNKNAFTQAIRNELPIDTYLELGIWYSNLNLFKRSIQVLETGGKNAISFYWLAWLYRNSNIQKSTEYLEKAHAASLDFNFPFRAETAEVLTWASSKDKSWKPDYLLALIQESRGNKQEAYTLLQKHENVNFAPFYTVRARLLDSSQKVKKLSDLHRALKADQSSWRGAYYLAKELLKQEKAIEASIVLNTCFERDTSNYIIGLEYIKSLIVNREYDRAEEVLSQLMVLPFEGAQEARNYYRKVKLMLAITALKNTDFELALQKIEEARQWPRHLGVGKPYESRLDENIEFALKAIVYKELGNTDLSLKCLNKTNYKSMEVNDLIGEIEAIF